MIPLGSCTMKLNATAEMEPITWPEFADLHPFAPAEDAAGTLELIDDLERWLAELTGYARGVAAAQRRQPGRVRRAAGHPRPTTASRRRRAPRRLPDPGERARHQRGVSAVMAGHAGRRGRAPTPTGDVDLDDLRAKIDRARRAARRDHDHLPVHARRLRGDHPARCATPCTHAGGQVYVDGANLNALVGLARPGAFGGDVSHLNLHKTFCIPHGGGGPGVGPVGGGRAPGAVPAGPPAAPTAGRTGPVVGGAVGQPAASCRSPGRTSG